MKVVLVQSAYIVCTLLAFLGALRVVALYMGVP